ncbi:hypothetical protein H9Q74_000678 [Fusarium xylarioides]|nr:hypothetical protein H9Q71_001905 [Fusarium xylarioides]KAG5829282.1 hypothetical protein H9Q74_000678 [Fusarium xylarioides]
MACFLGLSKIAVSIAEKAEFENDGLLEGVKLALTADHINTVKVLLPQVMTSGEWSILIELCCQQCHIGLLRHMLSDEFSDLMPGEDELKERLGDAARNGFWPIVSCLVQAGAPLGHEKEDLKILKLAVQNGYEGALSELFAADAKWTLVEYPAAIHETDGEELYVTSLLHEAAEYGSAPVIKALVHSGRTSIDIKCGEWNASALHSTAKADYAEAAEALLEAGADTTTADDLGTSVLLLACIYSSEKVVRVLLSHGADPEQEIRTGSKWKPLQIAAYTGNKNLVRLLLEYGAFPDAVHSRHGTPLNIAVDRVGSGTIDAYCQVLELLLGFNANPNTQNNHGSTPLHLALKHDFPGMERVIRILKQHGADVDKCDNKGNSPLFYALQGQHQNIKLLWDHDSVVDFDADHILPLLMDAAGHGLKARIEMLLRLGGDKEQHQHQRDKFGRHAHDVAFDADIRHLLGAPDFIGENNDQDGMCPFVKRYLYPKQDKSTPLPDWYCDDCGKSMGSGLFLHCRDCGADCEEVQTFDVCQNCEAGDRVSSCRERDHRLRWRFIGQSLLSIEELSPNIADFKEEDSGTVSDDSMIDV